MKKSFLTLLLSLFSAVLFAQSAQSSFEKSLPDSVKYVKPTFSRGTLMYKDGGYSVGEFNISILDNTLRYIDADGSEKTISDNSTVSTVSFGGSLFIRPQNSYLEVLKTIDDIFLCSEKKLSFDDTHSGAYGAKSATTNIKSVQGIHAGSVLYNLSGGMDYEIKETVFICKKNRLYAPSAKRIMKLFPDRKEFLEGYFESNSVDFASAEDLSALFDALQK